MIYKYKDFLPNLEILRPSPRKLLTGTIDLTMMFILIYYISQTPMKIFLYNVTFGFIALFQERCYSPVLAETG